MSAVEFANLAVLLTDIFMPLTTVAIFILINRAAIWQPISKLAALPLGLALIWASLWTWWPPLASIRFQPPPLGQGGAIFLVIVSFVSLLAFNSVRQIFANADLKIFLWLGPWRIFYGIALLVIGLAGGLPAEFFRTASFGDIAVGVWAVTMLARLKTVSSQEILFWNILGLADLIHVLAVGAFSLGKFFNLHPEFSPPSLLPIAGVPMMIAMHVYALWAYTRPRQNVANS